MTQKTEKSLEKKAPAFAPLDPFMKALGHAFKDVSLLQDALTHPSACVYSRKPSKKEKGGTKGCAYERLEFLGDRVLGLVVAHWLFDVYGASNEGELAKRHAAMVNRDALREIALAIGLEKNLRFAHEDRIDFSRQNLAILSDAMEAVIGAVYLDGGLVTAERIIKLLWKGRISSDEVPPIDPKSALQEYAQGKGLPLPTYHVLERSGPPHAPSFLIDACLKGIGAAQAQGASKREAEKAAAAALLLEIKGGGR